LISFDRNYNFGNIVLYQQYWKKESLIALSEESTCIFFFKEKMIKCIFILFIWIVFCYLFTPFSTF
jgi:hypothetical protein